MADTKNYGLKGVGDDVQFGKAGGRFIYTTGDSDFKVTDVGGSTLVHLQVLSPVGDTDAATKLYVDDVAAGLDFKESVTCATTGDMGATYAAGGGAAGNGQFTIVPATIDGVTLVTGDRVLVKNEGTPTENGIYVVTATTTIIDRATDHDSDAEVSAGNFTFVEEGTVNADTGWVLQGPDPIVINTNDLDWVLFSTSGTLIAGIGLVKNGNILDFDFSELTSAAVIATADELIFQDSGVESRITVANFLADRDIVTATADGILVRTSNDNYASRTLTAGGAGNTDGITISNGDGVSGNPTIGLDITGTAANGEAVVTGDTLLLFNVSTNANEEVTVDTLKTFMNAGTSATSITELNTTLAVSDSGTDGTLTYTADGTVMFTVTDTDFTTQNGLNFTIATGGTLTVADLTNNDVMIVGASGLIEDSGGNLTFSGSVLAVTGAATISTDLTVGESVYVTEQAAAGGDTAGDGQIWTRNDAPNTLMFTDDAGNDFTANNVLEIAYEYDSVVTTTDPGAGKLNFNSITIGSIATLYINDADNTARDNSFLLSNLAIGDVLTFRSASDPDDYIVASISSVTDSTGFWTIGLTLIHNGTIFADVDEIRISVEWLSKGISTTPTLITVADSSDTTSFPAFFESATGDLGPKTDASNYTYNASTGALTAVTFVGTSLDNLTDNATLNIGTVDATSGIGGNITINTGDGNLAANVGGDIILEVGTGSGTGASGNVFINTTSGSGAQGGSIDSSESPGLVSIYGVNTGSNIQAGNVEIWGGYASGSTNASIGGDIKLFGGGAGGSSAIAGAVFIVGGNADVEPGAVNITGGIATVGGQGGAVLITGGAGFNNNTGGLARLLGGNGPGTGNGGDSSIQGGSSVGGATGDGGSVLLTGGGTSSTNGDGGDIILQTSDGQGSGVAGIIRFAGGRDIRLEGSSITNYLQIDHDNTDLNWAGVNTTDWNITGITAINAGTVDADFDVVTATSYAGSNLTDNRVLIAGTSGLIEDDANFTFDGSIFAVTAAVDITGDLDVDNININGDTISNTSTDSSITIQANGTGSIIFLNGSGEEILELLDIGSAVNGLAITPGTAGNKPIISIGTGGEANVDIGFATNGTGVLSVAAGTYEANVTDDDDIPNKKYVDDKIALTGGAGTLDSVTGSVDLTTASTQNIGAATGIPANATIMSVTLDVTTLSDAVTTVTVGDATNGAASYMAASENDPEIADIYIADGRLLNGGSARQATATVAVQGTVGAATCIITFIHA